MNPDPFIFPAPEYPVDEFVLDNIVWIPRDNKPSEKQANARSSISSISKSKAKGNHTLFFLLSNQLSKAQEKIPCSYLAYPGGSDKIMLFFHGNGEDVILNSGFCLSLCEQLKVNFHYRLGLN